MATIDKLTATNFLPVGDVPFWGADKINEIIDRLNEILDGTYSMTNLALTGTLSVAGISSFGASTAATISAAGVVTVANVTDATTKDTGCVILQGGIGVEKNVYAGVNVYAAGRILAGNGTMANPAISFIDEPDCGFYQLGINQIGIAMGGVIMGYLYTDGIYADNFFPRVEPITEGAATAVAVTKGDGADFTTEITLTNFVIGPLAGAAAAKVLVPATKLFSFPAGAHMISASYVSLALTAAGTAKTPDVGLGTVAGDGSANATLNLSAAGAEDIMTGFTAGDTSTHAVAESMVAPNTAGAQYNISTGVKDVYLNAAASWAADNTGNLTATGTVTVKWTYMG